MSEPSDIFVSIPAGRRVWAISSPCGDAVRLRYLHKKISAEFKVGDTVVYLGNLMGRGDHVVKTIDEALLFRRALISIPGVLNQEVVFLRGQQEEMFHRLLQIQFAQRPLEVYQWMLDRGLRSTLNSYGINSDEGLRIIPQGVVSMTRWTAEIRKAQSAHDGHVAYLGNLKHAAFTDDHRLLFVHMGINHEVALGLQGDAFWWGGTLPFARKERYMGFDRVVRSFPSKDRTGLLSDKYYTTIVSGGGYDGPIYAVLFDDKGNQAVILES